MHLYQVQESELIEQPDPGTWQVSKIRRKREMNIRVQYFHIFCRKPVKLEKEQLFLDLSGGYQAAWLDAPVRCWNGLKEIGEHYTRV